MLSLFLAGCSDDPGSQPTPSPSTTAAPRPVTLRLGVFGAQGEVDAFTQQAQNFVEPGVEATVKVTSYADRDEAARAYKTGTLPDVFMLSQRDLAWFTERKLTLPVDEPLDERGVSFGDDYARDSISAFSTESSLACMPYSISPMVIYYNTDLVDFDKMRRRGLDAPENADGADHPDSWDFEQFSAAAQFATKPGRHTRGVYIEPSLLGLAPFIYSGGGKLFDDERAPTSLAFSDGDTRAALESALTLLRNAQVTPTASQLERSDPLTLFEEGKLGMIAGYRNLVPELRRAIGLSFDVMPMPKLGGSATVGDVTGLCISAATENPDAAADFLVHLLSEDAVATVSEQGYLVPANVKVSTSDSFLQPGRQPENAVVFNQSVRDIEVLPLLDSWSRLENAVDGLLQQLVTEPLDEETLDDLTTQIDLESQPILSPPTESPSPSGSNSASPSG
ncbi:MAG: extracellular solute-binding protein [Nocardioidaceae bacterium]